MLKILSTGETKRHLQKSRVVGVSASAYDSLRLYCEQHKMSLSNVASLAIMNFTHGISGHPEVIELEAKPSPTLIGGWNV